MSPAVRKKPELRFAIPVFSMQEKGIPTLSQGPSVRFNTGFSSSFYTHKSV